MWSSRFELGLYRIWAQQEESSFARTQCWSLDKSIVPVELKQINE